MGTRGPKNPVELSVIPLDASHERPDPPPELTEAEADVWKKSVSGMRPGWFTPATFPLLASYCMEAATAQALAAEMRKLHFDPTAKGFQRLASIHRSTSRAMLVAATKLRLCPSSNRSGPKNARDLTGHYRRPWEDPA